MAALRVAAALFWITGLGVAQWAIPVAQALAEHGEYPARPDWLAQIFGYQWGFVRDIQRAVAGEELWTFPAPGWFYSLGPDRLVPVVLADAVVALLEAVAGALIWLGQRWGAALGLALLPAGAIFWWGFGMPGPPLLALARTALIFTNWKALRA